MARRILGACGAVAVAMANGCSTADSGGDFSALEARIDALEDENAALREDLADYALSTDLAGYALTTDLAGYALTTDLADYALADETVRYIGSPLTIHVPADQPSLAVALSTLIGAHIGSTVSIDLADGTHELGGSIPFDHPDSGRITVRGNVSNPAAVVVQCAQDGFVVGRGSRAHLVSMTVQGADVGGTRGIWAGHPGSVMTLQDVVVKDFDVGVYADDGGLVQAAGVTSTSNVVGFLATDGSTIRADYATASNNVTGFSATTGSRISAQSAVASGNATGMAAALGGHIYASSSTLTANTTDATPATTGLTPPDTYIYR